MGPSAVANEGEEKNKSKYSSLSSLYDFTPIAVETLGAVGESALDCLQELGRRITSSTAVETLGAVGESALDCLQELGRRITSSTAVETLGAVGESALDCLQELGRRIASSTAEPHSFSFLMEICARMWYCKVVGRCEV